MLSTAFCLAASMVVGQADEAATRKYLKDLDCLVGDWISVDEVETTAAESETLRKFVGKKVTIEHSFAWTAGGGALTTDTDLDFAGEFKIESRGLTGWDPTQKKITGYSFTNRGGCWKQTWSKVDGNLVEDYEGVNLDGVALTGQRVFVLDGKDKLTIRSLNTVREGKDLPDTEKTYERKKLP